MKVIVGMDSFKGSLSSQGANQAVSQGIRYVFSDAEIKSYIMADGGEGTTEALIDGLNGKLQRVEVNGPLGAKFKAEYGIVNVDNLDSIDIVVVCVQTHLTH